MTFDLPARCRQLGTATLPLSLPPHHLVAIRVAAIGQKLLPPRFQPRALALLTKGRS